LHLLKGKCVTNTTRLSLGCARETVAIPPADSEPDDELVGLLVRMWSLASGRTLPRGVRPADLTEQELLDFWADDLSPACGRHATCGTKAGA
jgi:hypothetical protein